MFIWLSLLAFAAMPSYASVAEEADSAYARKQYEEAARLYQNVISSEGSNAAIYYNLGNAYYQTGDYGNAMLSWLRARKLDPSNAKVNANIRYLDSKVEDANKAEQRGRRFKTSPDEQAFFQSIHTSIAKNTSSDTWAVVAAVFFILFVSALTAYIFSRNVMVRKVGFFGGIVCLTAVVVFACFAFMAARRLESQDEGVILAFKVDLLTEPGKASNPEKAMILTKGTPVQILSEEVDAEGKVTWYKVRLNTDYIGWVAASDMERVGAL